MGTVKKIYPLGKKKEAKGYLFATYGFSVPVFEEITDGFSQHNKIGNFQFGEIYRGTWEGRHLIVKVWRDDVHPKYPVRPGDNEGRYEEENGLLRHFLRTESHPCLPKIFGFNCRGKFRGLVFHLKAVDSVHNLLEKDSFTWAQRMKVALGMASLLKFMHTTYPPQLLPFLIRNLDAAHIVLNEDYKPTLIDYSMISGGFLTDRKDFVNQQIKGCSGYVDPIVLRGGGWSDKSDVFSYGVLLLALISKSVPKEEGDLGENEYRTWKSASSAGKLRSSLVHGSFIEAIDYFYHSDGIKIAWLTKKCLQYDPRERPTMKEVFDDLQKLLIFRHHSDELNIDKILDDDEIVLRSDSKSGRKSKLLPAWHRGYASELIRLNLLSYRYQRGRDRCPVGKSSTASMCKTVEAFSPEELGSFTNEFSEENLIGKFQFGEVFRGDIKGRRVVVKLWKFQEKYEVLDSGYDNQGRLRDELELLTHPKMVGHPNLVKLIGYCYSENLLGIIYDLDPLGSVHNLVPDGSFTWLHRIKVAYEFACLLEYLHASNPPYRQRVVCNLDAAHIVLDQEYSPKLIDFSMFVGGIFLQEMKRRNRLLVGCLGYRAPDAFMTCDWTEEHDVYSYGVVLLGLLSGEKRTDEEKDDDRTSEQWLQSLYNPLGSEEGSRQPTRSIVQSSLRKHPGFYPKDGADLTKLALKCLEPSSYDRPKSKEVVKQLLNLRVMRTHAKELGIKQRTYLF